MRIGLPLLAIPLLAFLPARAEALDLAFSGYLDARVIAPSNQTSWVKGGLGKFRFGPNRGNFRFVEAVGQLQAFSRYTEFAQRRPLTVRSIVSRHSSGRPETGRSTVEYMRRRRRSPAARYSANHMIGTA